MKTTIKNTGQIIMLLGLVFFAACKKDKPSAEEKIDVYTAGVRSTGGKSVATVWKNGETTALTNGNFHAEATSVFVSGDNVYAAGYEYNADEYVAKVWKNGTLLFPLTNGNYYAQASSVFVSGDNVYVAGFEDNAAVKAIAKVWKNGEVLFTEQDRSKAYSVFVIKK